MKRMWRLAGLAAVWAVSSAPVAAGAAQDAYSACMSKAATTVAMQACQSAAVTAANEQLAAAYAKARAALPPDQAAKLRDAQRRWSAFRQADCDVFYGKTTGTLATISGGQCMLDRTRERIRDLAGFASNGNP